MKEQLYEVEYTYELKDEAGEDANVVNAWATSMSSAQRKAEEIIRKNNPEIKNLRVGIARLFS